MVVSSSEVDLNKANSTVVGSVSDEEETDIFSKSIKGAPRMKTCCHSI